MRIIVVGYGYYVLGNKSCQGGTVMPAIIEWKRRNPDVDLQVDILSRPESRDIAISRLQMFLRFYTEAELAITANIITNPEGRYNCGVIAVPETAHVEVTRRLATVVTNIICVKPVGVNQKDYNNLLDIVTRENINFYVDFHKRYDPANVYIISKVKQSLSKDLYFSFSYGQKREMITDYFHKWYMKSNPFQYLGPHYIDLVLESANMHSESIMIDGEITIPMRDSNNVPLFVAGYLTLNSESKKVTMQFDINWTEPNSMPFSSRQRLEVLGSDIRLMSEQDNRGLIDWSSDVQIPNPHYRVESKDGSVGYGIDIYDDYFSAVNRGRKPIKVPELAGYRNVASIIEFVNHKINDFS